MTDSGAIKGSKPLAGYSFKAQVFQFIHQGLKFFYAQQYGGRLFETHAQAYLSLGAPGLQNLIQTAHKCYGAQMPNITQPVASGRS